MSWQERDRMGVMVGVHSTELPLVQAGELMGVGYRQSKRIWKRYQADGDAGLVHRLRGQPGPRRKPPPRQWRERKPSFGAMVQLDGSHHDWFEGRGPKCVLMVMVDDATNQLRAQFSPEETTRASYAVLENWVRQHGLPASLYVSIYRCDGRPGGAEELAGKTPQTPFGRAAASPVDVRRETVSVGQTTRGVELGAAEGGRAHAVRRAGAVGVSGQNAEVANPAGRSGAAAGETKNGEAASGKPSVAAAGRGRGAEVLERDPGRQPGKPNHENQTTRGTFSRELNRGHF